MREGDTMNITLNDEDRREWVQNDARLYIWWKQSGLGLYRFVQENRVRVSEVIHTALAVPPVSP